MKLRLSELEKLTPEKRQARVRQLAEATQRPVNGEVKDLDREIAAFEARHGMNSETLRKRLADGEIEETNDICQWLMRLTLRDRLVELRARPH